MKSPFDKLPPHSLEAEMSLLGSMILDPLCVGDVLEIVRNDEMFYGEKNRTLFCAIVALNERKTGPVLDLTTILEYLRDTGGLEAMGGVDYLTAIIEGVSSPANALYFAEVVRARWRLRELITLSGKLTHSAYHPGEREDAANEILAEAEATLFALSDQWQTAGLEPLAVLLAKEIKRIDNVDGVPVGIPTHFLDLDEKTLGLQPEELTIIAARPSMGKTALALNICEQIAMGGPPNSKRGDRIAVGLFSLEMSRSALARRFLSARAGVPGQVLQSGRVGGSDYARLQAANAELSKAVLMIDDQPALNVGTLRARARRMVKQHGVKVIIVDYLQLLTAGGRQESRQVEVSNISRGLKALARELKVPVVVLSQLNRASEQREGNRPRMADLRESGSIEQDADVVILLHREEYYHVQDPQWAMDNPTKVGVAELIIAKQRNGPTGVVRLTWNNATTRFMDHAPGEGAEVDVSDFGDTLV